MPVVILTAKIQQVGCFPGAGSITFSLLKYFAWNKKIVWGKSIIEYKLAASQKNKKAFDWFKKDSTMLNRVQIRVF